MTWMLSLPTAIAIRADEPRDTHSDTWVATDALGRSLPTAREAAPPRPGKFVGVFYFLWLGEAGDAGPFDITKILARDPAALAHPDSPLWGPLLAPHHWGESIFGYYVADDESVLRKHAQMLADADVDMIVFDVTNQLTYPRSWRALCKVFDQVKRAGNRVPQIAFLCPFANPRKVLHELWSDLYGPGVYQDLWFRWEGKPLILADPAGLDESIERGARATPVELVSGHTLGQIFRADRPFRSIGTATPTWAHADSAVTISLYRAGASRQPIATRRLTNLADNAWATLTFEPPLAAGLYELELSNPKSPVGWWSDPNPGPETDHAIVDGVPARGQRVIRIGVVDDRADQIRRFFTFRKPQADYFRGPTGPDEWGWLEVTPQHAFYKTRGKPEEVAVGVAQNAADGKLSVFTNPKSHGRSFHSGKEPNPVDRDHSGRNFAEQWNRALAIDPSFIFITNWNEWIAGRFNPATMPLHGTGPVAFVDEFDTEFSRDIEPMKGGHGDNYYYQMIAGIRRFKGVRPIPRVTARPIVVDGRFQDWANVEPEFRDTLGDPVHRDHRGWGQALRYVNQSGRNDIAAAKVSFDRQSIAFYARTSANLTDPSGPAWMLLFIDADQNPETGWMGYDLIVNRKIGAGTTSVERNRGGKYEWDLALEIPFHANGPELELTVPAAVFPGGLIPAALDFKWADHIEQTGEWSDFTLNGDAAPNDRFNFRAILKGP